jgi:hypothetical protein
MTERLLEYGYELMLEAIPVYEAPGCENEGALWDIKKRRREWKAELHECLRGQTMQELLEYAFERWQGDAFAHFVFEEYDDVAQKRIVEIVRRVRANVQVDEHECRWMLQNLEEWLAFRKYPMALFMPRSQYEAICARLRA